MFSKDANGPFRASTDTPYIYIGGWAGNSDTGQDDSVAIDFGLQYSPTRHVWDVVAQFNRSNPNHSPNIHPLVQTFPMSIPPGTIVVMKFYALPQNYNQGVGTQATTKMHAEVTYSGGVGFSRDFPVSANALWNTKGSWQWFKRMVSIAQTPQPFNQFNPWVGEGSYHGTYIGNVRFFDDPERSIVFRAKRDFRGNVDVNSQNFPNLTTPYWQDYFSSKGPLLIIVEHPYQQDAHWTYNRIIKEYFGPWITNGQQGSYVGIWCKGDGTQ